MKTLSRTFAFVVLAVIAAVTLISCPQFFSKKGQKFTLIIGEYAEVADEEGFKKALKALKHNGNVCDIKFLPAEGATLDPDYCEHLDVSLKTDKVTKSEIATRAAVGNVAAGDPHATYKVTSADPTEIAAVLNTLEK